MNCNRKITYLSDFAILDLDNITGSSAYRREFNFAPFCKTKGSDKVSSKEKGILLIKRLNSNGLKMQPCRTPLAY